MKVSPACYAHFINALSCLANGKLCVLLEVCFCSCFSIMNDLSKTLIGFCFIDKRVDTV
jgi:hypothetical protein